MIHWTSSELQSDAARSLDEAAKGLQSAQQAAGARLDELAGSASRRLSALVDGVTAAPSHVPRARATAPTLRLEVHCAKGLQNTQTFAAQDPYVVASLGNPSVPEHWQSHRTLCVEGGGTAPTWSGAHNNEMDFVFARGATPDTMSIQIWNENTFEDDSIGTFKVNVAAVSAKLAETGMKAIRTWFEVMPKGSVQCTFRKL